jgi:predicted CXXCH cytochrome family protein
MHLRNILEDGQWLAWVCLLAAAVTPASAFHEGGVASCGGCHVMHESVDGTPVVATDALLLGSSPSDTCLLCHARGNGAVFAHSPLTPPPELGAGNFVFLLEDQINDAPDGASDPLPGAAAGHSIVAPGHGLFADPRHPTSPGGNFPSSDLGCTSCHDPHGNTNFRMLHGSGPVQGGTFSFVAPAPRATGIALDGPPESRTNHTAYLSGWTQWCGNCHGNFHEQNGTWRHPSGRGLSQDVVSQYHRYVGDAGNDDGTRATSYLPEVPIEDPTLTVGGSIGPSTWSRVSCMTCHRAHATSAPAAGRWDFRVERLDEDGRVSGSHPIPSPYPGPEQGSLCQKCHVDSRAKTDDTWWGDVSP